ncbi:hypothetical protein TNCV_1725201 [Trichonephila clavipes]|nr:hypothetical protein TNCV_1725201 [Trichonephila clavipes]
MLELFQQHLPTRVQSIFAAISPDTGESCRVADRVMEVTPIALTLVLQHLSTHRIQICLDKHAKNSERLGQGCIACQRSKVHRHTKTPLGTFALPDARFFHIHVDLIESFTIIRRKIFLLKQLSIDSLGGQKQ